jgi:uncharacterized phiE125 gp8 family phage protein
MTATVEPITLQQAKDHVRQVFADDDALITGLITTARQMVEGRTQRALVPTDKVLALDVWPCDAIVLPWPPFVALASTDAITYTDQDGAPQTLDPSLYRVNTHTEPVRITRANQATWPAPLTQEAGILVSYSVGYATPDDVPAPLKQWMLLAIGALYDNREQIAVMPRAAFTTIPDDFMSLLWQPYMVYS